MTQSSLKFAPYGTHLQPSAAMTSRKYFGNYGNYKPVRGGSTFAIRPVGSSPPKTGERPNEMTRTDEQRSRRTMLTVHNHLGDNVKKVFLV